MRAPRTANNWKKRIFTGVQLRGALHFSRNKNRVKGKGARKYLDKLQNFGPLYSSLVIRPLNLPDKQANDVALVDTEEANLF